MKDVEFVREIRDDRVESAKFYWRNFLGSLGAAAVGVVVMGMGVESVLKGNIAEGTVMVGVGGGVAAFFVRFGLEEVQSFAQANSDAAISQNELNQLTGQPG